MERLILMRHGEAERPQPGLEDFDRALDAEGRSESRLMGRVMVKAGLEPDLVLVSSARRAVETWRAAAEAFPGEIPMQEDQGLYAASATRLAAAVEDASAGGAKVILMVGHNPGIHQYAVHLARQAGASDRATRPLYERFPTGSAAVFAVKGGRPAFETLLLVRDYRDKQA